MRYFISAFLIIVLTFLSIFYLVLFTSPPVVLFDDQKPKIVFSDVGIEDGIQTKKGRITMSDGVSTDFFLRFPVSVEKKRLCLIMTGFLHGKEAVYYLSDKFIKKRGLALLAFDYYSRWPYGKNFLKQILYLKDFEDDIRLNMKICYMLTKVILNGKDVNKEGNLFIGASFGSFVCTYPVSKLSKNFSNIALLYSGSDISDIAAGLLKKDIKFPFLSDLIGLYLEKRLYFSDPVFSSFSFQGKKMLLISGTDDNIIPKKSREELFKAYPNAEKEMVAGEHISAKKRTLIDISINYLDDFYK
ncbi:MAG: hypothetical protein C0601_00710 [Candidatus Muiribacterium halophilum]|uniref:Peptidase S9 prolyl oligopeptidase catalytic domain-containing protein n=1 Tax=Muiribacterium halophilum TaxID=2053465 RepID=A0A2N5ZMQ4_MUIH1|nr:MAG: hypothetical protein C0601_00710 [Candidatus Muirbacterium halophilum]